MQNSLGTFQHVLLYLIGLKHIFLVTAHSSVRAIPLFTSPRSEKPTDHEVSGQTPLRGLKDSETLIQPDCGRAFQPCCASPRTCLVESLSCIMREVGPTCEPCGTPFAPPCPEEPYCTDVLVTPTQSKPRCGRQDLSIQCRPCGYEWQPCCPVLDNLCHDGFTCYSQQDRCVLKDYIHMEEEYFPNPEQHSDFPLCGGHMDPPCMEQGPNGTYWQCDDDLIILVPVFLCTLDTEEDKPLTDCGAHGQIPCVNGCQSGLTHVMTGSNETYCLESFSLASTNETSSNAQTPLTVRMMPTSSPGIKNECSVGEVRTQSSTAFSGELTYYRGAGVQGSCSQTWVPSGFSTVAINKDQYDGGLFCGTCIRACYNNKIRGKGRRCVRAIVNDLCPECKKGDLDLGEPGNGRWPVEWRVIHCPRRPAGLRWTTQGSNPWYAKVKVQGGESGAHRMKCNGHRGTLTPDGFFEFSNNNGGFECGMQCYATFINGVVRPGKIRRRQISGSRSSCS